MRSSSAATCGSHEQTDMRFSPISTRPYGNLGGTTTQSPLAIGDCRYGHAFTGSDDGDAGGGADLSERLQRHATQAFNFRGTSRTLASNLAYLLTDSIGSLNTPYWIESQADKDAGLAGWQDITTRTNRYRSTKATDWAFFAKG